MQRGVGGRLLDKPDGSMREAIPAYPQKSHVSVDAATAVAEPPTQAPDANVLHDALPAPHAVLHSCFRI